MTKYTKYNCTIPGNLFVGYEETRQKILDGFRNGNSYALIGGRRCGKTSFLLQIKKDIINKGITHFQAIPRFFDLQECSSLLTSDILFEHFFRITIEEIPETLAWIPSKPGKEYDNFKEHLDNATPLLNKYYGPDWLIILLVDEIDNIKKRLPNDNFYENLRNFLTLSRFKRHYRILCTGTGQLEQLISHGSPLNNLRNNYLRILTDIEAKELVRYGFNNAEDQNLKFLFDLTGKHPYILQGVLECLEIGGDLLDNDVLKESSVTFLNERGENDFQQWFNKFSPIEKNVYQCFAEEPETIFTLEMIKRRVGAHPYSECPNAIKVLRYHGLLDAISLQQIKIAGMIIRNWFIENNYDSSEKQKRVFICYAREDSDMAIKLYQDLKNYGYSPWIDCKNILPGQNWKNIIQDAMEKSSNVLLLLSSRSISKRGYVQKEQKLALDFQENVNTSDIYIIPVRIDNCEPSDSKLKSLHIVDLFPIYQNGFAKILSALNSKNKS